MQARFDALCQRIEAGDAAVPEAKDRFKNNVNTLGTCRGSWAGILRGRCRHVVSEP